MTKYVTYYDKPIFRCNYKIGLAVYFKDTFEYFGYCLNNKTWLSFKGADGEIGILTDKGIEFAESCCDPTGDLIKKLKSQRNL